MCREFRRKNKKMILILIYININLNIDSKIKLIIHLYTFFTTLFPSIQERYAENKNLAISSNNKSIFYR